MAPFGPEFQAAMATVVAFVRRSARGRARPLVVALDGRSGSGKSTLAAAVGREIAGTVVKTDDFFSGGPNAEWAARSTEAKVRDVTDWQRLRTEALEPLLAGRAATYHPANFETDIGLALHTVTLQPARFIVLDGTYTAHSALADVSVLVEVDDALRRRRLVEREGSSYTTAWHATWDDAEDYYFARLAPRESFDVVVRTDERTAPASRA